MSKNSIIEKHYRDNYKSFVNRVINRVPDRSIHLAEEVVQETYSRMLKYFKSYNPSKKDFDAWAVAILNNCANACRSIERSKGVVKDDGDIQMVEEVFEFDRDSVMTLRGKIGGSSVLHQKVLTLFCKGFTYKEIGLCVGKSENAVRLITFKFKQMLQEGG